MAPLSKRSVLESLSRVQLMKVGKQLDVQVHTRMRKTELVRALSPTPGRHWKQGLSGLSRNDLLALYDRNHIKVPSRLKIALVEDLAKQFNDRSSSLVPRQLKNRSKEQRKASAQQEIDWNKNFGKDFNNPQKRPSGDNNSDDGHNDDGNDGKASPGSRPTCKGLLGLLSKFRLVRLGQIFEVEVLHKQAKADIITTLHDAAHLTFESLLDHLLRDELKKACKTYGLSPEGRVKKQLQECLIQARASKNATKPAESVTSETEAPEVLPKKGDIVLARTRQYLVDEVESASSPQEPHQEPHQEPFHLIRMICLDDDDPGRRLDIIWELELGAKLIHPEQGQMPQLAKLKQLDDPRQFSAYLHALVWNTVTATDAQLFQSPFRAGIRVEPFQLTPLMKALELPRVNLAIFDDVGLGKTIEAGLVLQELLLRQQVDDVLIIAPPSVCLQWREEMKKRFGLFFEVYDRDFVARKRQEQGHGVNPWSTHNRFILSYSLLRRPEHLEPLIASLGEKKRKSLLILDEAHTVAPASGSRYAIDSAITKIIRDHIAKRFDNRLFLSATPHNGHSNSFSSLLEILDPHRFARGTTIHDIEQLRPVMVRRLKRDLVDLFDEAPFPQRKVVQIDLWHEKQEGNSTGTWCTDLGESLTESLSDETPLELELSQLLHQYIALLTASAKTKGARLALVGLQKRLLSSIPAFFSTLQCHAQTFASQIEAASSLSDLEVNESENENESVSESEFDPSEATLLSEAHLKIQQGSQELHAPHGQAKALLEQMLSLAKRAKHRPDARVLALLAWLRRHACPAVGLSPEPGHSSATTSQANKKSDRAWTNKRVLIFSESLDTLRYLQRMLRQAIADTEQGEDRLMTLHGGIGDDRREEVQRAFNDPNHPLRILLATDAAREGINLQGQCADLFHFDIPWNPARMEQRNGRIDRTLQPAKTVRCHYFFYRDRREDLVLQAVVHKVETIARELGSLGKVVEQQITETLEQRGIDDDTLATIQTETKAPQSRALETVQRELECLRLDEEKRLRQEIEQAHQTYIRSKDRMLFNESSLRETINVGLEMMMGARLEAVEGTAPVAYRLPGLSPGHPSGPNANANANAERGWGSSWVEVLDTLRPPRGRDESLWDWRKREPQAVVFEAPRSMTSPSVHLHLHHPFVRRVLDRFLSQGYGAHDLERVTVLRDPDAGTPRVIGLGRLCLFGRGARRLHDALIAIEATWHEDKPPKAKGPNRTLIETLKHLDGLFRDTQATRRVSTRVNKLLVRSANRDFSALWPAIQEQGESQGQEAQQQLAARAQEESEALVTILQAQQETIDRALLRLEPEQLQREGPSNKTERQQAIQDRKHLEQRRKDLDRERIEEPKALAQNYEVCLQRLDPVGLVYLYPDALAGGR